jgi:hypothetical protein
MARTGRVILAGQTYERLREAIIRGDIRPGERLNEARSQAAESPHAVRAALGRQRQTAGVREGVGLIAVVIDFGPRKKDADLVTRALLCETSAPACLWRSWTACTLVGDASRQRAAAARVSSQPSSTSPSTTRSIRAVPTRGCSRKCGESRPLHLLEVRPVLPG